MPISLSISLPDEFEFLLYDRIDSTNSEVKSMIQSGYSFPGTIIIANQQTNAYGKESRKWYSDAGNLAFSMILHEDDFHNKKLPILLITTLALKEALSLYLKNEEIKIKWPNDIMVLKKKISGVLVEIQDDLIDNLYKWFVIGVGVNIVSYPKNIEIDATSIHALGYINISSNDILAAFLDNFRKYVEIFNQKGLEVIVEDWLSSAYNPGDEIKISCSDAKVINGKFIGIDKTNGDLLIKPKDQSEILNINSGDVFLN